MNHDTTHIGPVIAIYDDKYAHLFADVELVDFHGVACLKGTALPVNKDDWRSGLTVYLPTIRITRIIEYQSLEQYREVQSTIDSSKTDD